MKEEPRTQRRLGRVVMNRTGLDGVYSFTLDWTPEGINPSGPDSPPQILRPKTKRGPLAARNRAQLAESDYRPSVRRPLYWSLYDNRNHDGGAGQQ